MTFEEEFLGKTKSVQYKILFAIGKFSKPILNYNDNINWLIEEIGDDIGGYFLKNEKDLPTEIGLYTGLLTIHSYQSNHPLDPVEWDTDITISGIIQINKLEL